MTSLLKTLGALPFALMPSGVRRRVVSLAFHAAGTRAPAAALRELLDVERVLGGAIDVAGMRYDAGVHPKHRLTGYHDFFVARVKPGERVLDVGSGIGALAHDVAERAGAHVVGIEIDPAHVSLARRRYPHPRVTFVVGDATLAVPEGPFDVIMASNVIEHIERRVELYRRLQTHVRPARWLVRVPAFDRDWHVPLRRELGLFPFSDPTHFTEYTDETFEAEVRQAGLMVVERVRRWGEIWAELRGAA